MLTCTHLLENLKQGAYDAALSALYAPGGTGKALDTARARVSALAGDFIAAFGDKPAALFSAPGRTELGGNHTDHQHGRVLCGSVDLDMLACAAPNGEAVIRVRPVGFDPVEISLSDLSPHPEEAGTSAALVRGVAAELAGMGHPIGGFDACVHSQVLIGSGLSSSAAFEVLIGVILNHFFCGNAVDAVTLAKIGQRAENVWFGKPCGLMDQTACAVGGAVAIDFADPAAPAVRPVSYDFARSGHALCIVDTRSEHADLTADYAAIPQEMGAVAAQFGKEHLRDVDEASFRAALPALRRTCGDRAVLRALHFFSENKRAALESDALEQGDFPRFLALVNQSGRSSALLLQNTWSPAHPERQAVPLALAMGEELLGGRGAIRVHGGGFAGTIQAFVPFDKLDTFRSGMDALLGEGSCKILRIRPQGGCVIVG